jgi:hypothetical protein
MFPKSRKLLFVVFAFAARTAGFAAIRAGFAAAFAVGDDRDVGHINARGGRLFFGVFFRRARIAFAAAVLAFGFFAIHFHRTAVAFAAAIVLIAAGSLFGIRLFVFHRAGVFFRAAGGFVVGFVNDLRRHGGVVHGINREGQTEREHDGQCRNYFLFHCYFLQI